LWGSEVQREPARGSCQKVIDQDVKIATAYRASCCAPNLIVFEDDRPLFSPTDHHDVPQRMCTPEMARATIKRWISLVPSKIV